MEAHEHLEHAEHIGHAGHGGADGKKSTLGRNIGMTMAVMGVLLALSSALVGGERTDFVATMVERANANAQYQSISTKYRVMQAQLQTLHAQLPEPVEFKKVEGELASLEASAPKDPKITTFVKALRLNLGKIQHSVTPSREDLLTLVSLVRRYSKQREAAETWVESYESCIEGHEQAAERYEFASLFAEIGIVMASIALLLHSRAAWIASITFGAVAVAVLVWTTSTCSVSLKKAEAKVEEAHSSYETLASDASEEQADEKLLHAATGQAE